MKKSLAVVIGTFLILLLAGLFVEVRADLTDEQIDDLLSSGVTVKDLHDAGFNLVPTIPLPPDQLGGAPVIPSNVLNLIQAGFLEVDENHNDLSTMDGAKAFLEALTFTRDGYDFFRTTPMNGYGELDNALNTLYQNLATNASSLGTGQSFVAKTSSYNGTCYKIVVEETGRPTIWESEDNGSTWELYK